jgi:DNA-binding CsgD family transcriptional regulator
VSGTSQVSVGLPAAHNCADSAATVERARCAGRRTELSRGHTRPAARGHRRRWHSCCTHALDLVVADEGGAGARVRRALLLPRRGGDRHEAWLLLLLARVRCRRGRLGDAEATLQSAREAIRELDEGGRVPSLAADVGGELAEAQSRAAVGELLDPPTAAELTVLRLLDTDLSVRQIGEELFLSANTVRTHKRSITAS